MCLSSCTFSCLFGFRSSSSPPWSLARDRCRDRSRDCCKNPRTVGTVEKDLLILTPPSNGPYGPWVFTTVPGAVPTTVPGQGPRDQKKRRRSPRFVYSASCAASVWTPCRHERQLDSYVALVSSTVCFALHHLYTVHMACRAFYTIAFVFILALLL